ncbi:MAG: hypothetical protein M0Z34_02345 [Nitrospiraceae bacterium]|nr:hypothetical protein [Nitrospiraceae bacterium]
MSPAPSDPRAQREAVSVAERLVRAFLDGHAPLVAELAGKVEELDGLGNYAALVAAARDWLAAGRLGPPGAEERLRLAVALEGDPLASLLAPDAES